MSSLYNLRSDSRGYQFTNSAGDNYFVYFTAFYLMDPFNEGEFIDVYTFGFECLRENPNKKQRYDAGTKATILSILKAFFDKQGKDAFIYICINTDGLARNRRITFGRWFSELKTEYERHQSHIDYAQQDWYSALLVRQDNPNKQRFIDAYHYTQKRMLEDISEGDDDKATP